LCGDGFIGQEVRDERLDVDVTCL